MEEDLTSVRNIGTAEPVNQGVIDFIESNEYAVPRAFL